MDIYKSNGELFTSLADGTTSNLDDAPIILAGRNFAGYGKILNENQLRLAENFASPNPPPGSVLGQFWYSTQTNQVYIYKGDEIGYKSVALQITSAEPPRSPGVGDIWFDTIRDQLKLYNGSEWIVIGPDFDKNLGETGAIPTVIADINSINHIVIKFVQSGNILALIAGEEFVPQTAISGFDTIRVGININSLVGGFMLHGLSRDSQNLGSVPANQYVRKDQDSVINADVQINGITTVGPNLELQAQPTTNRVQVANKADGADLELLVTTAGITSPGITINGVTGEAQVRLDPVSERGISSKQYVDYSIANVLVHIENELAGASGNTGSLLSTLGERLVRLENTTSAFQSSANVSIRNNTANLDELLAELAKKAPIESPMFLGVPHAQTPSLSADDDSLVTAEWVRTINDDLRNEFDVDVTTRITAVTSTLNTSISAKAPKANPIFTGTPRSVTADLSESSTMIATTNFVKNVASSQSNWQGSKKFVSNTPPESVQGDNGDFWFVIAN